MIGIPDEADQFMLEIARRAVVRAHRQQVISIFDHRIVKVSSPHAFTVVTDDHKHHHVPAGISEMPKSIALHWYAKANGVVLA